VFNERSHELERIDTGDYTQEEYETFLREIAFVNRYLGDGRAVKKTLLSEIETLDLREINVLDVGCGSGELLRMIAKFARRTRRKARLTGLDLNPISSRVTRSASSAFPEIASVQGDAFVLPFADSTFDYAISSLFFHHLTNDQIIRVLDEMRRVAIRGIVVIDLHRDPVPYLAYKMFCLAFGVSRLVKDDGLLSIQRGFRINELENIANAAGVRSPTILQVFPGRVVMAIASEQYTS
jgi:ubiquinone/menaquinone biosynthesis C-methylase UbiE